MAESEGEDSSDEWFLEQTVSDNKAKDAVSCYGYGFANKATDLFRSHEVCFPPFFFDCSIFAIRGQVINNSELVCIFCLGQGVHGKVRGHGLASNGLWNKFGWPSHIMWHVGFSGTYAGFLMVGE